MKFPHLVEMQRRYGKDGLVAVSVSLDDPQDKPSMARVEKFLVKEQATFPNLVLAEATESWQEKLKFDAPPCVFIFNRAGQWKKFDADAIYADNSNAAMDRLVEEWLKQ